MAGKTRFPRSRRRGPAILASTSLAPHVLMCLRVNVPWVLEIMGHCYTVDMTLIPHLAVSKPRLFFFGDIIEGRGLSQR